MQGVCRTVLNSSKFLISVVGTLKHKFYHPVHGSNVTLSEDNSGASRKKNFDNGLLFSAHPMKTGELFEVNSINHCCKNCYKLG